MHLCPVCLRKLHMSVGFDPAKRYRKLAAFFLPQHGLENEAAWIDARLAHIARATRARRATRVTAKGCRSKVAR